MRWILCGKGTAATECFDYLMEQGDCAHVVCSVNDPGQDGWQRSLKAAAQREQAPYFQPTKINATKFVGLLAALKADALISIQYDQILKAPLLRGVGCPCLNLHFSLLPRHRGVAPIAWAIASGDQEAGVTLHQMIEEIDAGDIISQQRVPISSETTARQLYDAVSEACVSLFRESYPFPPALVGKGTPQSSEGAVYHRQGDFDFTRRNVDWNRPALELQRWLRAMIFPPFQYPECVLRGRQIQITGVVGPIDCSNPVQPGVCCALTRKAAWIGAGGGAVGIKSMLDSTSSEPGVKISLESIGLGDELS